MIDLSTLQAKLIAGALTLVVSMSAGAAAGWLINGWRLDGDHQRELAKERETAEGLREAIREQNRAVTALAAEAKAADERRKLAEEYAARLDSRLGAKGQAVATSKQTNCDGVLREAWEAWK